MRIGCARTPSLISVRCDLGGGVTVTASGGAGCPAATSPTKPKAAAAPAKSAPAAAPAPAKAPAAGLGKLVGARIMTGMRGTMPSASLLARARTGQIGGVILFSPNISPQLPQAVAALQSAARAGGNPRLVIATDQEGGPIRRLVGAPPVAAPAQIAPTSAQGQGLATAQALTARGINTDLAPVADVIGPGGFLGSRSFGASPARVAAGACGFARGLQAGGVNATLVRAAKAGVDILLYDDEAMSARAYSELLDAARAGRISTGALKASAARIHQLGQ